MVEDPLATGPSEMRSPGKCSVRPPDWVKLEVHEASSTWPWQRVRQTDRKGKRSIELVHLEGMIAIPLRSAAKQWHPLVGPRSHPRSPGQSSTCFKI